LVRAQSRTYSSSSDEHIQPTAGSPMSSNDTSDDDDPNSILSHSRLRRKYVKSRLPTPPPPPPPPPPPLSRQQSLREQQPPASPTLRYASNGVLLRPKHQHNRHHYQQQQNQHSTSVFHSSSKDMGKKFKRFSLDTVENRWHQHQTVPTNQQVPESNIYRSSMAIVPSLNTNVYGVQINNNLSSSSSFKQVQQRDEPNNEIQQRPKVHINMFR
jgi:hypothetical protein